MIASICSTISFGLLTLPADAAATSPSEAPAGASRPAPSVGAAPSALRYVVANGDYLAGIATKLGVALADLLTVNQFTVASVIHPGQALIVPAGGSLPAPSSAATSPATSAVVGPYIVVNGDYLAGIAKKLGVAMPSLLAANALTATSVIQPGTKLTVPAGGALPGGPIANGSTTPPVQSATAAGPGVTSAARYTVQAGDYLIGIAARNGVTLRALLAANNLIVSSAIFPGRQLDLPPATLPLAATTTAPTTPAATATTATAAAATSPVSANPGSADPATAAGDAQAAAYQQSISTLITFLLAQVGKPYVFNTEGPDTYDCSGLVTAAYRQIGIELPHQSALQSTKGTPVDWRTEDLLPGDLIFQYNSAHPTVISHVGIVVDPTHWIQAVGSTTPVKIGTIPGDDRIQAVRRVVQP